MAKLNGDTQRIDKIERLGLQATKAMFGNRVSVGFLVSDEGDVLAGTVGAGYKYRSLREAIDMAKEPKAEKETG